MRAIYISGVLQVLGSVTDPVMMIPEESGTKWFGLTVDSGKIKTDCIYKSSFLYAQYASVAQDWFHF